jgi:uncharacterized membrane protein
MVLKRLHSSVPSRSQIRRDLGSEKHKPKSKETINMERLNPWIVVGIIGLALSCAAGAHFGAKALGSTMSIQNFPFNGAIIIGAGISFIGVATANEIYNRKRKVEAAKNGDEPPSTINTLHLIAVNITAVTFAFSAYYIARAVGAPTQIPDVPFPWAIVTAGVVNIVCITAINKIHQKRERERIRERVKNLKHTVYSGL